MSFCPAACLLLCSRNLIGLSAPPGPARPPVRPSVCLSVRLSTCRPSGRRTCESSSSRASRDRQDPESRGAASRVFLFFLSGSPRSREYIHTGTQSSSTPPADHPSFLPPSSFLSVCWLVIILKAGQVSVLHLGTYNRVSTGDDPLGDLCCASPPHPSFRRPAEQAGQRCCSSQPHARAPTYATVYCTPPFRGPIG